MSAIIVVDAFWGDSGKGKVAAFLAQKHQAAYSVRAGIGTNAGHSILFADGSEIRTRQLPCGFLHPNTQLRVGSGVAVDPELFFAELDQLDPSYKLRERTRVDYRCPLILPEYRQREAADDFLQEHGTTASGSGVARAEFALRKARQARDEHILADYTTDVARELNESFEGSQGTHLSLALSDDYPDCTSDNCTTAAFADDVGLNWRHIAEVCLVVKAVPSRVGTGPLPLQLTPVEEESRGIAEYGVATGRRRRKASGISYPHLETAVLLNGPTQLALTFCDHLAPEVAGARHHSALTTPVRHLIDELETRFNIPVSLCDCGVHFENLIEIA
ncbi:MAG: adenylosuccinate synthetase [Candidatus Latescibacteria bacterium]|nr:adenylosuccinate synthetase [Candidatus Latescibacterota bacterium]